MALERPEDGAEVPEQRGWRFDLTGVWETLVALWTDPVARSRAWIGLAATSALIYSLALLAHVLTWPEIGIRCAFTPVVNYFYSEFLYPEDQDPLERGDRIIRIAGQPVETWSQLLRANLILREVRPQVFEGLTPKEVREGKLAGNTADLDLGGIRIIRIDYEREDSNGTTSRSVWCRVGRTPIEGLVPGLLWFCLNIGVFIVGAIVYWKRPDDRTASLFFLLCLVTLGAFLGGYHWSRIVTQTSLIAAFMVCAVFLPAVTLHFYLVFPQPKAFFETHHWRVLLTIYLPPLLFLALFLKGYMTVRWLEQGASSGLLASVEGALRKGHEDTAAGVRLQLLDLLYEIYFFFVLASLWYLASLASLVHSYRTAANVVERNQVKWILCGSAAALIPLLYTLYLAFWESGRFGSGAATWPMFAASLCITLAYTVSITRYRLLELDRMLSSGAVYVLILVLAGLVYYGVVFVGLLLVGSHVFETPALNQMIGVAIAAMILVVVLDVIRGRLLRAVDRHLRKEKHQLDRTLQRMSQAIEKLVDPPRLARQLLHTTAELLSATSGAIYLRRGDPPRYALIDSVGVVPPLSELPPGSPLVEALRQNGLQELDSAGSPAERQLGFLHGVVSQALFHEGQMLGLLVLGPRTENGYSAEDRQILSAFAQIVVVALLSAEGHRTIEALNRELKVKVEKIAEQQRRILTLQSQLNKRESAPVVVPEPVREAIEVASSNGLIGSGTQVRQLLDLVRRVATSSSAVLLRGESGTGKELLARALHENSPRANKTFVKVHCAALSPGLLESELFGHVRGAFTSAIRDKVGRFELADGGTLFLDEIGDISLEVQTKLLRVLEEMTFERVGSSDSVEVDVRIIAATHRDLDAMIAEGKFREDLFFRLNVLPIRVPPLRERVEDIPELTEHFLRHYSRKLGKAIQTIDDDALAALKGYRWPGNVRQLENVIERAVVIAEGSTIGLRELPTEFGTDEASDTFVPESEKRSSEVNGVDLPELASAFHAERADRERREREQLVRALAATGGNKAEAARALGLARSTLISRLKKFGLS